MKTNHQNLSNDPVILHQIINALSSENNILSSNIGALIEVNRALKEQLILLKKQVYGQSSEKINKQIEEIEQRLEENESEEQIVPDKTEEEEDDCADNNADDDKQVEQKTSKKRPKRKKLPENLSRTQVIIPAPAICPDCGGDDFRTIADDVSEVLEYVPSSFKVIQYIRPRCACKHCEKIVQGYAQSKGIDKGKAGTGLLAHILVQKYCDHLPMYRQSQIYAREGIELSRSTLSGWAGSCARLLEPLINELKKQIFASSEIHGDDTTLKVLAPEHGKTKTARLWVYVRDGRPHGSIIPPAVCYFYSPDRKGERPFNHLKDFRGVLHADAYGGYDQIYKSDDNSVARIIEAACWAHTRRKFYEVTINNDKANIAFKTLEQIAAIYKIEEEIRGLDPDERRKYRQERSKGLVQKLFIDWKKFYNELPKKSSTAQAISYAMNNEVALMRFLDDGKIEIDNNAAERAMRSIAVGRKNWLFAGSDRGGDTAAAMYSLIETAKLNNINPWKYLQKVLGTIQDHNSTKIAELLPWNLKLE